MSHVYCPECGYQNPEAGSYCSRCGALMTWALGRWFCPREIYPFWREAWVRPVEESDRPDVTA